MQRQTFRFILTFAAGAAAVVCLFAAGQARQVSAARYEDLNLFTSVLNLVRNNYVEPVDENRLIQGAIEGMLAQLDPHSSFLTPDIYKEMQIDTKGEFAGLGIEIAKREDGYIEVIAPIEGTPADRAGLKAHDQIVEICPTETPADWKQACRNTKAMSLIEAVQLMRGKRKTKITIQILREGFEQPRPFTLERDMIKVVSTEGRLLEPGYAYARLRAFQENTSKDLQRLLEKLAKQTGGRLQGLVLDLRDNPGGLLDQAIQVADIWVRDGLIVYTKGRAESQQQEFRANESSTEDRYPLVVLVNSGTASASEIVAGALQDHRRALVLGTETFGKGSVQTIVPLDGGAGLRLTTALYYTPGGRSIQEVGIVPDMVVSQVEPATAADAALPSRIRERDLERHFTQEEANPSAASGSGDGGAEAKKADFQLARALEVLKSWSYFEHLQGGRPTPASQ